MFQRTPRKCHCHIRAYRWNNPAIPTIPSSARRCSKAGPDADRWSGSTRWTALGVATTTTLRRPIDTLEQSTVARFAAAGARDKLRRFKEFYDGAASWDRVERIIARIEAGPDGVDTRFIATNLDAGTPRIIDEKVYCQRGQAENHIKSFNTHLAADRTSCHTSSANQLRLFLHPGAYWMMWHLRVLMPRRSSWRVM